MERMGMVGMVVMVGIRWDEDDRKSGERRRLAR